MSTSEPQMTTGQLVALLDAALGTPHPLCFLDAVMTSLQSVGRHQDGTTAAWMGCLIAESEIEVLTGLRAAWKRGECASLGETARDVARRHRTSDARSTHRAGDRA